MRRLALMGNASWEAFGSGGILLRLSRGRSSLLRCPKLIPSIQHGPALYDLRRNWSCSMVRLSSRGHWKGKSLSKMMPQIWLK